MKLIYTAGPYTASTRWDVEKNIRDAEEIAYRIIKMGAFPVCPHANCRYFEGLQTPEFWYKGTLTLMKKCDAVMLFGDWINSEGAVKEYKAALWECIPIFNSLARLDQWVRKNVYLGPDDLQKAFEACEC
jgi:hypothetical protein